MSKTVTISSTRQFAELLQQSRVVVADFYADWCGPCQQVAPIFEQLSTSLSRPKAVTFVKINIENQKEIATTYKVSSIPTFIVYRNGQVADRVQGANPRKLQMIIKELSDEANAASATAGEGSGSSGAESAVWRGAALPRGYTDITDQVEMRRCDLLNSDDSLRVLFDPVRPSALDKGKAKAGTKDWIETSTDHQLLLFMPFRSVLKLHTLQLTSLPPSDDEDAPMRPSVVHLFTNHPHNLDFGEADDTPPTQAITLSDEDWNADGTANIPLRFVKFQNINSVVLYVVEGAGDGEVVRLDRVRLIGESGEKREMGKLEKIGDLPGE